MCIRDRFSNDQALVVVGSIVLINSALYLTSNFIIYFFKYDFGGTGWKASYTLFSTIGGAAQILGMMVLYPVLRKKLSNTAVFTVSLGLALGGYAVLLLLCLAGLSGSLALLCVPGVVVLSLIHILIVTILAQWMQTVWVSGSTAKNFSQSSALQRSPSKISTAFGTNFTAGSPFSTKARTESPRSKSCAQTLVPINPAAPVTR